MLYHIYPFILVKITAEDKKNKDFANVSPDTYDKNLANKPREPTWR